MRSIYQRCLQRIKRQAKITHHGYLKTFDLFLPYVQGRFGLEIGGPSDVFRKGNVLPVYEQASGIDNCDFSGATVWAKHNQTFLFNATKPLGRTLLSEGSVLAEVDNSAYDFVLSSHNLEHFANPVKALKEWQRVMRPGGALILALPYYKYTFDHRRKPTSVEHMLDDHRLNMGEDDLTHLPEILERHDLTMDLPAGSKEEFHKRSLDNFSNRCLHHHVFDERNSRELLSAVGFEVLLVETGVAPHILIFSRMNEARE
jgi:SAM-dependent methyltransferase